MMSNPTGEALLARIKELEEALGNIKVLARTASLDATMYELTRIQIDNIIKEVDRIVK